MARAIREQSRGTNEGRNAHNDGQRMESLRRSPACSRTPTARDRRNQSHHGQHGHGRQQGGG